MRLAIQKPRGQFRQPGFTLVEIMLVMIILALMAGVMMTNMREGYLGIALDGEARQLSDTIQAAQLYARIHHRVCRLVFDADRQEYYVSSAAALDQPFRPAGSPGDVVGLSKGIVFSEIRTLEMAPGNQAQIRFFPDGRAEPAWITLAASSGEKATIKIDGLSGAPGIDKR